jgi:acetoin utilization deacetylase AcuC-like enzyme
VATGYVWLERYGWHDTGTFAGFVAPNQYVQPYQHFESAESKVRLASLIEVSGLGAALRRLDVQPVSDIDVKQVHDELYIDWLKRESEQPRGGLLPEAGSPFSNGAYEIAKLAAGGTYAAIEAVLRGQVDNAYALVRPPGHHAESSGGMGFCLISNIAVATQKARRHYGLGRVAVVDWDVHHGNGTQEIFYEDRETLTISIHQDQLYPVNTGFRSEAGAGAGVGANLNIPLPAGCGTETYLAVMDRVVIPALDRFKPELIVVACGFDAGLYDPLGRMMVTADGFRALTARLKDAAARLCEARLVMSHEGGYSAVYVPVSGLAVIEELSGVRTPVEDVYVSAELAAIPDQQLKHHQGMAIEAAALLLAGVPSR